MAKKYFLTGIGGISMSGIAKYLLYYKNQVSGSDLKETPQTQELTKLGAKIYIGHKKEHITPDIDCLIYSSAAATPQALGRVEIEQAQKLKIPFIKRSEFIGQLMADKYGIAISGMHGKTTTTAMLGYVLKRVGLKPTIMLGGNYKDFQYQNLEIGSGDYFVCEACEYDRSFLDFVYQAAFITNIEEEHLDYFNEGLPEIIKSFQEFIDKIPQTGFLVVNIDDKNIQKVIQKAKCQKINFSKNDFKKYPIKLKIPGDFNKLNAVAVIKFCQKLGIPAQKSIQILEKFLGVERRFEYKGQKGKVKIFDDYAHHPTEIKATLKAARQFFGNRKILLVFQPHQYSRTKNLFPDLVKSFSVPDMTIICDVYEVAGREEDKSLGSKELVLELQKHQIKAEYTPNYNQALKFLKENFQKFDIIITMGAGPINLVGEGFLK